MSSKTIPSAFKIEIRFAGGLSGVHKAAFRRAASRWSRVIVGDLPAVQHEGDTIDDLLIVAEGLELDGPNQVLGQSGPTVLRGRDAGPHAFLPAKGEMSFDVADLEAMQREGTLEDVIAHEMGHVLGIGTIWSRKRLIVGATSDDPVFRGKQARAAYGQLLAQKPTPVPIENLGGKGTRNSHWRESIFGNELMSGFVEFAPNPISIVTVASLADLGYEVDLSRAEGFSLPVVTTAREHSVAWRVLNNLHRPIPVVV